MGLNKTKGNMYDFVTHTWNPIKGKCSHDCIYCHPKGTLIMMADFTQKPIENIIEGDSVIGIKKENSIGFYKFEFTNVIAISKRKDKTIRFFTDDNELECTPEHPLMGSTERRNNSDWKSAKAFSPYENLRYISKSSRGVYSLEQRLGYIKGVRDGDGCVFEFKNKEGRKYLGFELVCVNDDLLSRIKDEFLSVLQIPLNVGIKRVVKNGLGSDCRMLHTRTTKYVNNLEDKTKFRLNKDFAKGYIAGMIDTDGSVGKSGAIRISQSEIVNKIKFNNIIKCLKFLNIEFVKEENNIRINSSFLTRVKLLFDYGIFHSEKSKRLLMGKTIKGCKHSVIKKIEAIGECTVYNLQTESENFIANGFIVHNCYMKRWGEQKPLRLDVADLKTDLGSGNFIFVGSSTDMWAADVPSEWIKKVLHKCAIDGDGLNQYLFQSKNPKRFRDFRLKTLGKIVLGTTIESNREFFGLSKAPDPLERAKQLGYSSQFFKTMVTIEPILDFDLRELTELIWIAKPDWVNIGANTSKVKMLEPSGQKIKELIVDISRFTKVRQKKNLDRLKRAV